MFIYMFFLCFIGFYLLLVLNLSLLSSLGFYFFNYCGSLFFSLEFSFMSVSFSFVVGFITFMVFLFSTYYMSDSNKINQLNIMILLFVLSMMIFIHSNNFLTTFVGWDCLGAVSYFLISFDLSSESLNNSMFTYMTNRLGDVFLFLSFIGLMFMSSLSSMEGYLVVFFFVIAGLTKSAQFPFSSWLVRAMSAPTPVSALVHSSTLIVSGIWLFLKFYFLLSLYYVYFSFLVLGLITMFVSSFVGLFENDVKKVVALSTLSQVGMMLVYLGLGSPLGSFFHLLGHAFFKSSIFICVGIFLVFSFHEQGFKKFSSVGVSNFYILAGLGISLFSLCGLLFSSGHVTKDLFLLFNSSFTFSVSGWALVMFSVILTFMYSLRLFFSAFTGAGGKIAIFSNWEISGIVGIFLILASILFGWWFNHTFLVLPVLILTQEISFVLWSLFLVFCVFIWFSSVSYESILWASTGGFDFLINLFKFTVFSGFEKLEVGLVGSFLYKELGSIFSYVIFIMGGLSSFMFSPIFLGCLIIFMLCF